MSEAHIHILFGSDEFAIARGAGEFLQSFADATTADMNTSRLDARDVPEDELYTAVHALPFLAPQRVVLLTAPSKRYGGADGHRKFLAFLEGVPPSTQLVILEPGEIRDKEKPNHWLLKWTGKPGGRAEVREFNLPGRGQMPGWIVNEAKRQRGQIEPRAAAHLAEMIGEDTRQASMEITKLLTYVDYAHPVGVEDVQAVSILSPQGDIFALVDAMAAGNTRRAQKLLHQLLEGEEPFSIFGMVVRQFRLLIVVREVIDESGDQPAVIESLRPHFSHMSDKGLSYRARELSSQARAFGMERLEAMYRCLLQMDEEAKTSQVPLDLALDMFIAQIG